MGDDPTNFGKELAANVGGAMERGTKLTPYDNEAGPITWKVSKNQRNEKVGHPGGRG